MRTRSIEGIACYAVIGKRRSAVPGRNDYFDGTAEIEEARIVLPEMVPCAVTI